MTQGDQLSDHLTRIGGSEMPRTYTVEEVAKILRIGRSAAYEAVNRGQIPHIRVGRFIRISEDQLQQLLGRREEAKTA